MNRKDFKIDRKKANMQDLRKKEKENRKLQLELNQEKEKFNQMVVKYQKELNEMQAVKKLIFNHIVEYIYMCVYLYICIYEFCFQSTWLPCFLVRQ